MSRASAPTRPGDHGRRVSEEVRADVFTQEKLDRFYRSTFELLYGCKHWLTTLEDILVWNKPVASAVLYIFVHWLFIMASQNTVPLLSRAGNLVLLGVICDVLWRAANNNFENSKTTTTEDDMVFYSKKTKKKKKPEKPLPFEEVYILSLTPLKPKELPCFDVVCLWLATAAMWLDNLYVALRHWSVHEPLVFFVCMLTPGVFLSLLGKYIPTIVVMYIFVMGLLVWPYMAYHDLTTRAATFLQANYPRFMALCENYWLACKVFVAKDRTDFFEVALGSGGDDQSTAQALQDAFEQATHLKNDRKDSATSRPPAEVDPQVTKPVEVRRQNRNVDPGMSVLQDSVLGMHPQAFKGGMEDSLGSLALPPGGFDPVDQSIALTRFPPQPQPREQTSSPHTLSTITEDDISLPTTSNSYNELDPFADSIDIGHNWPDGSSNYHSEGSTHNQQPTGTSTPSTLQQITEDAYENATDLYSGGYHPPPSYQAAAGGYDGAIASSGTSGFSSSSQGDVPPSDAIEGTEKGGYMLRRRQ